MISNTDEIIDINDIKLLLKNIFIVSSNEEDGINLEEEPTPCQKSKFFFEK